MVQKKMINDKTKLVKEAKNDKASRCWFAYQKRLGKMRLGEMLPNPKFDVNRYGFWGTKML